MTPIMNAAAFAEEAAGLLDELELVLEDLREDGEDVELLSIAQRALHTLSGAGRLFGFAALADVASGLEPLFMDSLKASCPVPDATLDKASLACARMRESMVLGPGDFVPGMGG